MVPHPSAPKIRHSLWHRLLRRRQRQHAHRTKMQRQQVPVSTNPKVQVQRRKKVRVAPSMTPILPVPFYVHVTRLLIVVMGASVIGGTSLSVLQSVPRQPLKDIYQHYMSPKATPVKSRPAAQPSASVTGD